MPPLPDPDFNKFGHGMSLLGGWLPVTAAQAFVDSLPWIASRFGS
jgi:hypothetical protein